jgi:rod shape determining protein RodA
MFRRQLIPILIGLLLLFFINILMLSSLAPNLLFKQILAWAIGIFLFFVGRQINPKQIASQKWLIFVLCCIFVTIPALLNNITRGSYRWINIGPVSLQPSELVKPWLMLFLSVTETPLLHLIPVALVASQPDLGSAMSLLFLMVPVLLYNSKLQKLSLIALIVCIIISPFIWSKVLHDYQRQRITNFLNPNSDPLGQGYNVIQSKIAIGSGGIFGKGYKKGTQGQLLFLPEKHTDFMFAATAEEMGLIGIASIIFAYYLLIKSLLVKAYQTTSNKTLFLFTLGIALQLWMQIFVNIGMNIGILPVTGIPLPFLSVGGSSIMTLLFSLGVIFSS